jgi:AraC family transcriptional regulator of adaptative response/methylated-DNA-[protein]-cysteine methyltransferase
MSKTKFLSDEARWAAVQQRDHEADGQFWYSVRTTGVYCRPVLRRPAALRGNVAFHASPADAEAAGFRACLRCKPDQPPLAERHAAMVAEGLPPDRRGGGRAGPERLAEASGMSRFHFHRIFKAHHRHHAESLCGRAARRACSRDWRGRLGHRRDLRGRLQFQRPLLRERRRGAGHDAEPLPRRRQRRNRSALRSAPVRWARSWWPAPKGICAILMGDDPDALARDLQDRFPKAELIGAEPASKRGGAGGRLVEAPASASTCRWTCAAPPSSSACGRRCADPGRAR